VESYSIGILIKQRSKGISSECLLNGESLFVHRLLPKHIYLNHLDFFGYGQIQSSFDQPLDEFGRNCFGVGAGGGGPKFGKKVLSHIL